MRLLIFSVQQLFLGVIFFPELIKLFYNYLLRVDWKKNEIFWHTSDNTPRAELKHNLKIIFSVVTIELLELLFSRLVLEHLKW